MMRLGASTERNRSAAECTAETAGRMRGSSDFACMMNATRGVGCPIVPRCGCTNLLGETIPVLRDVACHVELVARTRCDHRPDAAPHGLVAPGPVPETEAPHDASHTVRVAAIERPLVVQVKHRGACSFIVRRPEQQCLAPEHSRIV